jgi:hypothetical protein
VLTGTLLVPSPPSSSFATATGSGGSWSGAAVAAWWKVDDAGRASWSTLVAYVRATVLVAFIDAVGIGIFLVISMRSVPAGRAGLPRRLHPDRRRGALRHVAVLVALVDSGPVTALIIRAVVGAAARGTSSSP